MLKKVTLDVLVQAMINYPTTVINGTGKSIMS
jgi:hypothetical protein